MNSFTQSEKSTITRDIQKKYLKVAVSPQGQFRYPTGEEALRKLGYNKTILNSLPESLKDSYCGTGNPFPAADLSPGEIILDYGCGAGVDTIFAGHFTGSEGRVIGVDIMPQMLKKASENLRLSGLKNVDFLPQEGETLSFEEHFFDTIITNSVINLVPEKEILLGEFYRCLKPGGRLIVVDQIFTGREVKEHTHRVKSWFQ